MSTAAGQTDRAKLALDAFVTVVAAPAGEQMAVLENVTRGDPELRRMVEAMLRQDAGTASPGLRTGGGLLSPGVAGAELDAISGDQLADLPALSGHYRVLRELGEGAMGVVYLAEQSMPRRLVALKAVKSGLLSRQLLRRFMLEAHILGRLHHPGIAQIFEAGAVSHGGVAQACLVMEFIEGAPITTAARAMSVRQRVELMARVCDAAQHAHQRGVIHRDLKPSNIMVTTAGEPKVLDFGVARSDFDDLPELGGQTQVGQIVGTLGYMSPEQLEGGSSEADASSDVYALGAVLYELLAGRPAFDLRGLSLSKATEAIRTTTVVPLRTLGREFKGDLETIVATAMQADRQRRYSSAAALAEDLRRYIDGRAIIARRDSSLYVLSRVARRHWLAASISLVTAAAIFALAVWSSLMANRNAELATEAQVARGKADRRSELLAAQLRSNTIERARGLGQAGNLRAAEEILWPLHQERPDAQSGWALWELYTQMPCRATLAASSAEIWALALSSDERRFATGDNEGQVMVWSSADLSPVASFRAHPTAIRAIALSPDGETVITGAADGSIAVWNAVSGRSLATRPLGSEVLSLAAFEPAAGVCHVAAACRHGTIRVIDAADARTVRALTAGPEGQYCISADRTGRLLAVGASDGRVQLWSDHSDEPRVTLRLDAGAAVSIALSADGSRLGLGGGPSDRWIRTWSVEPGVAAVTPIASFRWRNGTVRSLQFSPDGQSLLAGGYYRFEILQTATCQPAPGSGRFSQTTQRAVWAPSHGMVIAAFGHRARIWRDSSDSAIRRFAAHPPGTVVVEAREANLYSGGSDGVVRCWTVAPSGDLVPSGELPAAVGGIRSLSLDETGRFLTVVASGEREVLVWDLVSRTLRARAPVPTGAPFSAALSPGANWVASVVRGDATVRVWDVVTGKPLALLDSKEPDSTGIAVSASGDILVSCHSGGRVIAWDTTKWQRLAEITRPTDPAWCVSAIPGTASFALGSWVGTATTWEPRTGKVQTVPTAHSQVVADVVAQAMVPPGISAGNAAPVLASASSDGSICFGDPQAGLSLATLPPFGESLSSLAFAQRGTFLIAATTDGKLTVIDLREGRTAAEANASLIPAR